MKTSKKKIEEDYDTKSSVQTLDPFAVDFFGVKDTPLEINEAEQKASQKNLITQKLNFGDIEGLDWYKYLPTTTTKESLFSNQLLEFPNQLNTAVFDCLAKTFSKHTKLEKRDIKFEIESVQEANLFDSLIELNNESKVFLTLKSDLSEQSAYIALDRLFSSNLIDFIVGGKGKKNETLRKLSAIEKTVIEYLGINLLSDLNNDLSISTLNLLNVSNEIDTEIKKSSRGAKINLNFILGKLKSKIIFISPIESLTSLEKARKSVFLKNTAVERFGKIKKITNIFNTNVLIGNTNINAIDLPFLEKEDVILIENQSQFRNKKVKVFIGDGTNYYLNGDIITSEDSDVLSDEIIFEVEEVVSEKDIWIQPKREKMDIKSETENEKVIDDESKDSVVDETSVVESDVQDSYETHVEHKPMEDNIDEEKMASLENVMVNLRVNLGGRRLSLDEIQNIRVGQIIELGCRPNDPVEIVTDSDNKPIATGELLEIEGHLGVRLTKILV